MNIPIFWVIYIVGAVLTMAIIAFESGYAEDRTFNVVDTAMMGMLWPGLLAVLAIAVTITAVGTPFILFNMAGRKIKERKLKNGRTSN